MVTAGAIPHAPMQRKASIVNNPSSVVSPGATFKSSQNLSQTCCAPLT